MTTEPHYYLNMLGKNQFVKLKSFFNTNQYYLINLLSSGF